MHRPDAVVEVIRYCENGIVPGLVLIAFTTIDNYLVEVHMLKQQDQATFSRLGKWRVRNHFLH